MTFDKSHIELNSGKPSTNQRWMALLLVFFSTLVCAKNALADWRGDIGVFRVGVVMASQLQGFPERAEPFRLALSEALGIDVEFFPARNVQSLVDALAADRIEYAVLPATAYALTWQVCECVEPITIAKSFDGTDGFHSVLISGPGGPQSIREINDTRIAVLSSNTVSQGLLLQSNSQTALNLVNDGSPDATLKAFAEGKYTMLLGWSSMTGDASLGFSRGTLNQIWRMGVGDIQQYRIIWQSEQIPHSTHVLRSKLAAEPKNIIRNLLTNLLERDPVAYDSIEPHFSGGFNVARHSRFEVLVDLIEKLGRSRSMNPSSDL